MPLTPYRVLRTFKYAMYFDGIDDYVSVADNPVLSPDSFTVEMMVAWISPPTGYSFWAGKGDWLSEGWQIFQDYYSPSRLWFETYDAVDNARKYMNYISAVPQRNIFYHIVFTYKSYTGQYAYVDTQLVASKTDVKMYKKNTKPLYMKPAYYNSILVAFFRFYTYNLSIDEIAWNYLYPDNPVRNGLVLWLQAHPSYVKDIDGDGILEWIDLSGFGNHGKIYGATLVELVKTAKRVLTPARILTPAR